MSRTTVTNETGTKYLIYRCIAGLESIGESLSGIQYLYIFGAHAPKYNDEHDEFGEGQLINIWAVGIVFILVISYQTTDCMQTPPNPAM
jgi:hypothetical protein